MNELAVIVRKAQWPSTASRLRSAIDAADLAARQAAYVAQHADAFRAAAQEHNTRLSVDESALPIEAVVACERVHLVVHAMPLLAAYRRYREHTPDGDCWYRFFTIVEPLFSAFVANTQPPTQ